MPKTAPGLTQAGLSRINQSIEAFVYCILGAQVNIRSSLLGEGGRAKEAQTEFLTLMEDARRQPDLSKSVQRYLATLRTLVQTVCTSMLVAGCASSPIPAELLELLWVVSEPIADTTCVQHVVTC